jgi:hypothetical protein
LAGIVTLKIPSGVYKNGTRYQSKGRYYDSHLVRFYEDTKRPVGGWQILQETTPEVVGAITAKDLCTDANGTAVTSHTPDSGFTAWQGGIGAFALNATIQSNKIAYMIAAGGGSQVQHNFTATTLPFASFDYMVTLGRPADGANQQAGFFFRGNGNQYNGVTNDGIYVYWDRVSSTLVDLKLRVQEAGTDGQQVTVLANYAWAQNTEQCLGVVVSGNSVQVYTAAAGYQGALIQDRTDRGSAVTLTAGHTLNDSSHRRFGAWLRQNPAVTFTFDTFVLKVANTAATVDPVAVTGTTRKLLAWKNDGVVGNLAIGTNSKIYVFSAGGLTDLTPGDLTAGTVDTESAVGEYGAGAYGSGNYGEGDLAQAVQVEAGSWQLDTFGEFLVGVMTADGRLLYWDGLAVAMEVATGAPTSNKAVVTTAERFVVLLGAGGDPRKVQWPDRETIDTDDSPDCWTPDTDNEAGDFLLPGTGDLLFGKRGANETLLFTSDDVWAMRYVGGTLVYSFVQLGTKCGACSRHAGAMVDGKAFWMDLRGFFKYDGQVQPLPLDVTDYVFSDFNKTQAAKVFAVTVSAFGEIYWFYPSANSDEPNRYVCYNYIENHASIGQLTRTAGIDRDGVFEYPTLAKVSAVYQHERGTSHEDEDETVEAPYLESGPIELGEGERVMDILGVIPDESQNGAQEVGALSMTLFTAYRPDSDETEHGPYTMSARTDVRLNARTVRVRHDEIVEGDWRLGDVRLEVASGGER